MENVKATATKNIFTTKQMALIGVVTAITCILAPMSVPLPITPVPISLTNLVLYVSVFLLGWKSATVSYIVYLLIGFAGLPVFSGFTGGLAKLAGPTGGYLIGMIFIAIFSGYAVEKGNGKRWIALIGMVLGTIIDYVLGTFWLSKLMHTTFTAALSAGVLPFIPGDLLKIIAALILGPLLRSRVNRIAE